MAAAILPIAEGEMLTGAIEHSLDDPAAP